MSIEMLWTGQYSNHRFELNSQLQLKGNSSVGTIVTMTKPQLEMMKWLSQKNSDKEYNIRNTIISFAEIQHSIWPWPKKISKVTDQ